jgi:hypothetical protein
MGSFDFNGGRSNNAQVYDIPALPIMSVCFAVALSCCPGPPGRLGTSEKLDRSSLPFFSMLFLADHARDRPRNCLHTADRLHRD